MLSTSIDLTVPLTLTTTDLIRGRSRITLILHRLSLTLIEEQLSQPCNVSFTRADFSRSRFHAIFQPHRRSKNNTRSFSIAGKYCEPQVNPGSNLLIVTHGLSLDRSTRAISQTNAAL
ncbi:hypothetical protein WAI453_002102 [Rhynchosporium graminicola]